METLVARTAKVGETIEYSGAAYVGKKPMAGRRGKVVSTYKSPAGRTMLVVLFGKSEFAMPECGPFFVVECS